MIAWVRRLWPWRPPEQAVSQQWLSELGRDDKGWR